MTTPGDDAGEPSEAAIESEPALAAALFGDRIAGARAYCEHLATTGVEWGLIGPRELPRLWTRHILNCAVVAELIAADDLVGDVGSGAGLPGIPLALARPDASFVLIEPMERRVEWLSGVVDDLGLTNVRIVRARVEDLADEEMFTVVTSRAVKSLAVLVEWAPPSWSRALVFSLSRARRTRRRSTRRRSRSSAPDSQVRSSTRSAARHSRSRLGSSSSHAGELEH